MTKLKHTHPPPHHHPFPPAFTTNTITIPTSLQERKKKDKEGLSGQEVRSKLPTLCTTVKNLKQNIGQLCGEETNEQTNEQTKN